MSSPGKRAQEERLYWPQLDGLRALAFFLVFISHLNPLPVDPATQHAWVLSPVLDFINTLKNWGWIGVELFFVLSAFLITTILLKEREKYESVSFKAFFMRRVLRIWPLYYFFILLAFIILPLFGFANIRLGDPIWTLVTSHFIFPYLFFLTNTCFSGDQLLPAPSFMAIPWSVAIEEQFYVFWGLVLSKVRKLSTLWLFVLFGLPFTMLVRWHLLATSGNYRLFYYATLGRLDAILIGIVLALLLFSKRIPPAWVQQYGRWLFLGPVAFYIGLSLFAPTIQANHPSMIVLMTLIAVSCGLFLLSILHWPSASQWFSHPVLTRIGKLTYGMYMLHLVALEMAMELTGQALHGGLPHNPWAAWLFYIVVGTYLTWIISSLSWHFVEKHFYKSRYQYARIPSGFGS